MTVPLGVGVGVPDGPTGVDVVDLPGDARICHCNGVSEQTLCDAVNAGCSTVDAVIERTRAGTCSGSCTGQLQGLVDWAIAEGSEGRDEAENASTTTESQLRTVLPLLDLATVPVR